MLIRALAPEDAASFTALRLRGLQEFPEAFASSYEEEVHTPVTEVARRLESRPDRAVFGAFEEASLVAIVGLQREGMAKLAHKAFVWGMYVAPESRRKGIGAALLRHALAYAGSVVGVRQVSLGVNTRNTAAVLLYRGLGFVQYGLEKGFLFVGGEYHDEYQMVCHVHGAA
jgi:ribosomal protein S18 acetylase RimI-like enzyme